MPRAIRYGNVSSINFIYDAVRNKMYLLSYTVVSFVCLFTWMLYGMLLNVRSLVGYCRYSADIQSDPTGSFHGDR